ncbi:MAG: hypothetical protein EOR84_05110 [Mesorhizobium sp.]|uniref:hypothetical protein n=1 Tax=Mesorhizobium sp. TaxID=1871066 RepID=UPI000FE53C17|nr:hypothetical protein [Mesorhizobium sp.]RWN02216.1 MAG: hypothetical protein EOR84_05110 [Mesorhizobium sp.]
MKNIGCLGFAWKRLSCQAWSVRLALVRGVLVGLAVLFSAGAPDAGEGKQPSQDHPERRGLGLKLAGKGTTNTEATLGRDVGAAPTIDWGRSLFVRKLVLLEEISFTGVMDQLVASSNGRIADRDELFRNWWSTAAGDDCEELRPKQPNGRPPFPYDCSRAEGMLKDKDPYRAFGDGQTPFIIVAAVNRVDLLREPKNAPPIETQDASIDHPTPHISPRAVGEGDGHDDQYGGDGGDCGEFRLIAGKHPDWKNPDAPDGIDGEMLIAFEAVMPNGGDPKRCMAIQKFWLSLSEGSAQGQTPLAEREREVAILLRKFFLEGITLAEDGSVVDGDAVDPTTFQLPPAMHVDHLGASESSTGQIRTNSKLHQGQWGLREYRFDKESMRLLPTRTTGSPEPTLFSKNSPDPEATKDLVKLVLDSIRTDASAPGTLLDTNNINSFRLPDLPEHLLAAEMNAEKVRLGDYAAILDANDAFLGEIKDKIKDLFPVDAADTEETKEERKRKIKETERRVRKRIQSLSCAGCHKFSGRGSGGFEDDFGREVCWQVSSFNKHVTAKSVDGEYPISPALERVFLPHREYVMRTYLAGNTPEDAPPKEDMSTEAQLAWEGLPHC